jgi:predicted amidohydrolase
LLRVAICQDEVAADLRAGVAHTAALARRAAADGAQLIVFPETWLPGYPAWLDVCRDVALWDNAQVKAVYARMAAESVTIPGNACDALASVARDTKTTLVVGVVERVVAGRGAGTLYNAILTFGPDGRLLNHHRKLVPTYTEQLVWGRGDADGLRSVRIDDIHVGALVCWEHWMPLARQALHEAGEDVHVALWPTVHEMHQVASRQYAFEGRCYVLAAGSLMRAKSLPPELEPHPDRVTSPDHWILRGGSAIIGPDGRYVVEPTFDRSIIVMADLDLVRTREERMTLDVAGHYARDDALSLTIHRTGRSSDTDSVR